MNLRYEEIDRPVQDSEMEEVREGRDLAPFLVFCMVRVKKSVGICPLVCQPPEKPLQFCLQFGRV